MFLFLRSLHLHLICSQEHHIEFDIRELTMVRIQVTTLNRLTMLVIALKVAMLSDLQKSLNREPRLISAFNHLQIFEKNSIL